MNEGEVVLTPEQIQTLRGYASRGVYLWRLALFG
ncbi:putative iron-regulated protein FrpC [Neisseria meningitidis NM174]|nr:putative iron-regulated protein FrpC [Neisseria meningitidis NM174]